MQGKVSVNEAWHVLLLLFFGTIGYIPILMPSTGGTYPVLQAQAQSIHSANHVILLVIWLGIALELLQTQFRLRTDLLSSKVILAYAVFVSCSTLLFAPISTAGSGLISLYAASVYAIYFATNYSTTKLLRIFSLLFAVLALGSAFLAVGLPKYGLDHFTHAGAWQGLYVQKNTLGLGMTFGVGVSLALQARTTKERLWKYGLLFLCLAEVGLSESREAWVIVALVFVLHFGLSKLSRFALRSRSVVLGISLICIVGVSSVVLLNWTPLLKALGRDPTLTGRTQLWTAVLAMCKQHPLLGYGGAFWGTPAAFAVFMVIGWPATSAHNGFLENLLDNGVLGLASLCLLFLVAGWAAFRVLRSHRNFDSSRVWIYSVFIVASFNMVQDTTGFPTSISWLLLLTGACKLEMESRSEPAPLQASTVSGLALPA